MKGTIKKVVQEKGFGFISPEDGGKDIFFHVTDLAGDMDFNKIQAGEAVVFDVSDTPKGQKAIGVAYDS